jgi:stage II sporulation protein M
VVTVVFVASLVLGLLVPDPGLSRDFEMLKKLSDTIKTLNPPVLQALVLVFLIFLNNALKSLLAIVLGIGFGLFPLFLVEYNGKIVGFVAGLFSKQQGILFVAAALLPHGIIEVPMVLISAGIGLRMGYMTYISLKSAKPVVIQEHEHIIGYYLNILIYYLKVLMSDIKPELMQSIRFYFRRIVPLLFVAALIETFVTPLIASIFLTK